MFRIGDFSRFSRVSVKRLRHYDEIGLLKPAWVDGATRYRYYSADQLPRLNRILALRDLGFPLEQIATLLDDDLSAREMRGLFQRKRAEIEQQLREDRLRLARVEARIEQIETEGSPPPYDVVLRSVPAQLVAATREVVDVDGSRIAAMFDAVEAHAARHGVRAGRPPLLVYHDPEHRDDRADVEAAVPLSRPSPEAPDIRIRELDAVPAMACVVHTGDYAAMHQAFNSLFHWVAQHGYETAGPLREVYLRFAAGGDGYELPAAYLATRTSEFVTELQAPVSAPQGPMGASRPATGSRRRARHTAGSERP